MCSFCVYSSLPRYSLDLMSSQQYSTMFTCVFPNFFIVILYLSMSLMTAQPMLSEAGIRSLIVLLYGFDIVLNEQQGFVYASKLFPESACGLVAGTRCYPDHMWYCDATRSIVVGVSVTCRVTLYYFREMWKLMLIRTKELIYRKRVQRFVENCVVSSQILLLPQNVICNQLEDLATQQSMRVASLHLLFSFMIWF